MDADQTNLSLEQALGILRRRAPWILLCLVLVAGGAYAFSKQQTKKYTATAPLLFNRQLAALPPKERASAAGATLQSKAQVFGVLAGLRTGNVQVAQPASVPTSPSSPRVRRNTILGAVVGFLLGLAVAFLLERLDW